MTMTNKIKGVELVWTLGAMLANSAELANEGSGGGTAATARWVFLIVLALAGAWFYSRRRASAGYRHVSLPLHQGHDSDA